MVMYYLLFTGDSLDENLPFEYVEIHDTENTSLTLEGLSEPVDVPFEIIYGSILLMCTKGAYPSAR